MPTVQTILVGQKTQFLCQSPHSVVWTYQGDKPLPSNARVVKDDILKSSILEIQKATQNDGGYYTCTVDHDNIVAVSMAQLKVRSKTGN